MEDLKIYRCRHCGNIAVKLHDAGVSLVCCGEEMELLKPNTTDAALEKHVPVVTREDGKITVTVGSVEHPMAEDHYIEFIILQTAKGYRVAFLKPGDRPSADFYEDEPVIAVYEYCNKHGLWKTEA